MLPTSGERRAPSVGAFDGLKKRGTRSDVHFCNRSGL